MSIPNIPLLDPEEQRRQRRILIDAAHRVHDFRELLSRLTGETYGSGHYKIFCPFHDDYNNPSAQLFDNDMYCFTCQHRYSPYDVLRKLGQTDIEIRRELPEILPDLPVSTQEPFFDEDTQASHILFIAGSLSLGDWSKLVAARVRALRNR